MQCDMTDIFLSFSKTFMLLICIMFTDNRTQCIISKQYKQPIEDIHIKTNTSACNIQVRMLMWGIKRYSDPQNYHRVTMITAKGHYMF